MLEQVSINDQNYVKTQRLSYRCQTWANGYCDSFIVPPLLCLMGYIKRTELQIFSDLKKSLIYFEILIVYV